MNIPLSWLREATGITDNTNNILTKMTEAGNAVEGLTRLGEDITGVVVGKILTIIRHPDADKLWVTTVDTGTEALQIVTGADNLKVGDIIPVAVHGSTLANGLKIKKSKMRGQDSNGMLVSIDELGYTTADFPEAVDDGIYVFQDIDLDKFPPGSDVKPILELDEEVADFDILSNRPDTNSVMGMAREVCAVYDKEFRLPQINLNENGTGQTSDYVTVEILDPESCPRYIARVVQNVKIAPSPQWLRRRLSSAGLRPINNIVDITNYVMLEYGQPLHAFDISAVAVKDGKHGIVVRKANKGEKFTTLDGVEHVLDETNLFIADHEKPVAIAGVMGGVNSMITGDTAAILFESACFDKANIRLTSRSLGMRTDASARYEKGQDPNQALTSVNRAMELVELLDCGDVVPGLVDCYPRPRNKKSVTFTKHDVNSLLGTDFELDKICNYLRRVGIQTEIQGETACALIPSFRSDISAPADIAEEAARFYGLNNIISRYYQSIDGESTIGGAGKSESKRLWEKVSAVMVSLGYYEALTFPFESPKSFDKLLINSSSPLRANVIELSNPLSEELSIMRPHTLVNGLLEAIALNIRKSNEAAALFEICYAYQAKSLPISELPLESPYLVFACYGKDMDYFSVKGDVEELLESFSNCQLVFTACEDVSYMHPGRSSSASIRLNPNPRAEATEVGHLGEVHPVVLDNYSIGARVYIAVISVNALKTICDAYSFKFSPTYNYPPIDRDLAFKVPIETPASAIEAAIKEKGGTLLKEVNLFDVYTGQQVGDGFKSVAYALRFRDLSRTLKTEDVEKPIEGIIGNLEAKFGAEIRKTN